MEKVLISGNEAMAQAAINAGCDCYFGYPITPQTEIGEYLSREMPQYGRAFVCAESEIAAINMVMGAASTGKKAMTSSASCAIALMQEGLSYAACDELPLVLISVMRAGPGLGYIYPSQADYNQAVTGGGNGDYRIVVLAPSSVQESIDLTYRAFYLSQKYRTVVIVLSDGLLGQSKEPGTFTKYPYEEVDNTDWALTGAKNRSAREIRSLEPVQERHAEHMQNLFKKYDLIIKNEVSYEEINTNDADVILVAFGSLGRNIKAAMNLCRQNGLKVGILRPITLFPFPEKRLYELSKKTKQFLTIEMNMGQMVKDVKLAIKGQAEVDFLGRPSGEWFSAEEIFAEVVKITENAHATSI